jgi:hypothetical protein
MFVSARRRSIQAPTGYALRRVERYPTVVRGRSDSGGDAAADEIVESATDLWQSGLDGIPRVGAAAAISVWLGLRGSDHRRGAECLDSRHSSHVLGRQPSNSVVPPAGSVRADHEH